MEVAIVDNAPDVEELQSDAMLDVFHHLVDVFVCVLFKQVLYLRVDSSLIIVRCVLPHVARCDMGDHVFDLSLVSEPILVLVKRFLDLILIPVDRLGHDELLVRDLPLLFHSLVYLIEVSAIIVVDSLSLDEDGHLLH